MKYTVEFTSGGNKITKEVEASSEKEAIELVKNYVYNSVSYGAGHNFKIKENLFKKRRQLFEVILNEDRIEYFKNRAGEWDSCVNPVMDTEDYVPPAVEDVMSSSKDGVGYWTKRFEKNADFDTVEGLEDLAEFWNNTYFSDLVHDLRHDGAYQDSVDCARALSQLKSKILRAAARLGLTSDDCDGKLSDMLRRQDEYEKKQARNAKARASRIANKPARLESYKRQALAVDNEDLKALLNDDGSLKERKSWAVIKDYLDTPEGKIFKNLWINQFK